MPDVYPLEAPEPAALLGWDGTDYRVPSVDPAHHLQVDVLSSALPAGGATQATLAAILAELLTHTLPVGAATQVTLAAILAELLTHTLPVGAATQATLAAVLTELQTANLQHFDSVWRFTAQGAAGVGDITVDSGVLGAGDLVVITNAAAWITAGSAAAVSISIFGGATVYTVSRYAPVVVGVVLSAPSPIVLVAGDLLRFMAGIVGAGTVLQARAVGYYVST